MAERVEKAKDLLDKLLAQGKTLEEAARYLFQKGYTQDEVNQANKLRYQEGIASADIGTQFGLGGAGMLQSPRADLSQKLDTFLYRLQFEAGLSASQAQEVRQAIMDMAGTEENPLISIEELRKVSPIIDMLYSDPEGYRQKLYIKQLKESATGAKAEREAAYQAKAGKALTEWLGGRSYWQKPLPSEEEKTPWVKAREEQFRPTEGVSTEQFRQFMGTAGGWDAYEQAKQHFAQLAGQQAAEYMGGRSAASYNVNPNLGRGGLVTDEPYQQAGSAELAPFLSQLSPEGKRFWAGRTGEILEPIQQARKAWWSEVVRLRREQRAGEVQATKYGDEYQGVGEMPKDPLQAYLQNFDFANKFAQAPRQERGFHPRFFAPPTRWG